MTINKARGNSPTTLLSLRGEYMANSGRIILNRKLRGGVKKSRFSVNVSLHHGNDTRRGNGYYGVLIGSHEAHFDWKHSEPSNSFYRNVGLPAVTAVDQTVM